ncbi:hypothetical protein ADP8_05225 (plasmid) [Roseomonas mucosa]|nr:hypothetical protein ADP8_05225 [Roseomonas mucosa]
MERSGAGRCPDASALAPPLPRFPFFPISRFLAFRHPRHESGARGHRLSPFCCGASFDWTRRYRVEGQEG